MKIILTTLFLAQAIFTAHAMNRTKPAVLEDKGLHHIQAFCGKRRLLQVTKAYLSMGSNLFPHQETTFESQSIIQDALCYKALFENKKKITVDSLDIYIPTVSNTGMGFTAISWLNYFQKFIASQSHFNRITIHELNASPLNQDEVFRILSSTKIDSLTITGTLNSPFGFKALGRTSNIKTLKIESVFPVMYESISQFKTLESLDIRSAEFSNDIIQELTSSMPNLKQISVPSESVRTVLINSNAITGIETEIDFMAIESLYEASKNGGLQKTFTSLKLTERKFSNETKIADILESSKTNLTEFSLSSSSENYKLYWDSLLADFLTENDILKSLTIIEATKNDAELTLLQYPTGINTFSYCGNFSAENTKGPFYTFVASSPTLESVSLTISGKKTYQEFTAIVDRLFDRISNNPMIKTVTLNAHVLIEKDKNAVSVFKMIAEKAQILDSDIIINGISVKSIIDRNSLPLTLDLEQELTELVIGNNS